MRLDEGLCAITVSGKHKGRLEDEDIMLVDMTGKALDDRKPSAETLLHTQLYEWSPQIQAVLHTHSPAATVFTLENSASEVRLQGYELLKAFPGIDTHEQTVVIPVFDNTQDIPALAKKVQHHLDAHPDTPAYLIRGHGVYTWGDNMSACERHLEAIEFLLECECRRLAFKHSPSLETKEPKDESPTHLS